MNVLVERYQRRKYVNQPDSQMLYYVRQKSGTVRVMDINKLADAIEANSSLTAGDVKHSIEAFVEQLRLSLTQGDKVKIDGLGTFHITLSSEGAEKEKDCTVRNIRRVNVRFVADKALQLVNTSHATTRGENNVDFILAGKGDGEDADGGNSAWILRSDFYSYSPCGFCFLLHLFFNSQFSILNLLKCSIKS